MSDISKRIDEVVRLALSMPLKAAGFKKNGRTFLREEPESIAVINVQASQGNFGASGQFTLNLGRYYPALAQRLNGAAPLLTAPSESECHLRKRIGQLMPQAGDHWWELDEHTDLDELALEITDLVQDVALPWLATVSTPKGLHASDTPLPPLTQASLALLMNDPQMAADIARDFISERPMAAAHIRKWAAENGVVL